ARWSAGLSEEGGYHIQRQWRGVTDHHIIEPGFLTSAEARKLARLTAETAEVYSATARLVPMGRYPSGAGEAYGMCLWHRAKDGALFGFVVMKDGRIDQVAIDLAAPTPKVTAVRSMKLGTQAEGCVVDDRTGLLYVAEEDVGLWRFAADPAAPTTATAIAQVDGRTLVADAEGLALAPRGRTGGYLVVSSQGDNAYTLYRLPGVTYAGRFRIGGGAMGLVDVKNLVMLAPRANGLAK
ncbi:hypothetical protein LTR94_029808, partial [Friedmanniomyces endolithicus]